MDSGFMTFEKVDLFCPKCGKYSVYKSGKANYGCNICLSVFSGDVWETVKWELSEMELEMTVDEFGKVWFEGGWKK